MNTNLLGSLNVVGQCIPIGKTVFHHRVQEHQLIHTGVAVHEASLDPIHLRQGKTSQEQKRTFATKPLVTATATSTSRSGEMAQVGASYNSREA